jgi:hypothetical protein
MHQELYEPTNSLKRLLFWDGGSIQKCVHKLCQTIHPTVCFYLVKIKIYLNSFGFYLDI